MGAFRMIKSMFAVLLLSSVLLASSAFAQSMLEDAPGASGCGNPDVKFQVKTDKAKHPAELEAGKALVYFIQDDSEFTATPKPTTRAGLDGKWVGATHTNSYFYFSVDPGVHNLCASWQSAGFAGHKTAAAHFTAEAGGVYYFVVKNTWLRTHTGGISVNSLDGDRGQFLANSFLFSTSHPKQ